MRTNNNKKRRAGFTLIEIMVVVLIVGLLLGTVGPSIWNALFSSQSKMAGAQIQRFHEALDMYWLDQNKYPDTLEELTEPGLMGQPYLKKIPLDPWKNEYEYEIGSDGQPFITSMGKDGSPGGENENADITTETIQNEG